MKSRILKLIFLFIVLAPVQDQAITDQPEKEGGDSNESYGSCTLAVSQEIQQAGPSLKLSNKKQGRKNTQFKKLYALLSADKTGNRVLKGYNTNATQGFTFGKAFISESLLRNCYRSKSSRKIPRNFTIA